MRLLLIIFTVCFVYSISTTKAQLSKEQLRRYFYMSSSQADSPVAYTIVQPFQLNEPHLHSSGAPYAWDTYSAPVKVKNKGQQKLVAFEAFGKNLRASVAVDDSVIAPGCLVQELSSSDNTTLKPCSTNTSGCLYTGRIVGQNEGSAVFNLCGGVSGTILMEEDDLFIEPLVEAHAQRFRRQVKGPLAKGQLSTPHIVFKRPNRSRRRCGNNIRTSTGHSTPCTRGSVFCHERNATRYYRCVAGSAHEETCPKGLVLNLRSRKCSHPSLKHACSAGPTKVPLFYPTSSGRRTRHRRANKAYHAEIAVYVDEHVYKKRQSETSKFILTSMAVAAARYRDSTLGADLSLSVVSLVIMKTAQSGLQVTEDSDASLSTFCRWQEQRNPSDDGHPQHADATVLVTGLDIHHRFNYDTTGLAYIGGVCSPTKRCSINEDTGIDLALTIAHELGHNFGMSHDGDANTCQNGKNLMATSGGTGSDSYKWSSCSRDAIDELFRSQNGACLHDLPSTSKQALPVDKPGVIYSADEQCRLSYGQGSRICTGTSLDINNDKCSRLVCFMADKGQITNRCTAGYAPWLDGSECGQRKWCESGRCVPITSGPAAEDGGWSSWSRWSSCSRTCGGGLQSRSRKCDNPVPRFGGANCAGLSEEIKFCKSRDCKKSQFSFRSEQCAATNNQPYDKKTYNWIASNTDQPNQCMLWCQPVNLNWYLSRGEAAPGTQCPTSAAFGRCFKGKCYDFGCDGKLNSKSQFDVCRVCGGSGNSCSKYTGSYNKGIVNAWATVVTIPRGATSIVAENGNVYSKMTVKSRGIRTFGADGTGAKAASGTYAAADSEIRYTGAPEKLELDGPTSADIIIEVWRQYGDDYINVAPDIKFSYYLPKGTGPQPDQFQWKQLTSACSRTCGSGRQELRAVCTEKSSGRTVSNSKCDIRKNPGSSTVICNKKDCPAQWETGTWGGCSKSCGGGLRRRTLTCKRISASGTEQQVASSLCPSASKPGSAEVCNKQACPGRWIATAWGTCSKSCGQGSKARQVKCTDPRNSAVTWPESKCLSSTKPPSTDNCYTQCVGTDVCRDERRDCPDYASQGNVCNEQRYQSWVLLNCRKTCGKCSGTGGGSCVDKEQCELYGPKSSVCGAQYVTWAKENCKAYCGHCQDRATIATTTTAVTTVSTCRDQLIDCADYGQDACRQYPEWARSNCEATCGFCAVSSTVAATCTDTLPNCDGYNLQEVCKTYVDWSRQNCQASCNLCSSISKTTVDRCSQPDLLSDCSAYGANLCTDQADWARTNCYHWCFCGGKSATTTPATTQTNCRDKVNCESYDASVCRAYKDWSRDNCPVYCGLGCPTTLKTTTTTTTTTTTPRPCVDRLDNCDQYGDDVCTNSQFTGWAKDNCYKFCFCARPTTTQAPCVDISDKCNLFGNAVCQDYKDWASDNCRVYCKLCTPTYTTTAGICRDLVDCQGYGTGICTNQDYRAWMLTNCPKFCGACK